MGVGHALHATDLHLYPMSGSHPSPLRIHGAGGPRTRHGWQSGAHLWDIALKTKALVEAQAQRERAEIALEDVE